MYSAFTRCWSNIVLLLVHGIRNLTNFCTRLVECLGWMSANMKLWPNVLLMLVHCLRRWHNFKTTVGSFCLLWCQADKGWMGWGLFRVGPGVPHEGPRPLKPQITGPACRTGGVWGAQYTTRLVPCCDSGTFIYIQAPAFFTTDNNSTSDPGCPIVDSPALCT